jgi:cytochrome c556
MFGMSAPMTGIMVDLLENEPKNAQANYEKFKTQYQEVSKLVPEWTSRFPLSPVEDLGKALKTGKQEPVIAAFEKLDGVCMACHVENMVPAQHKYHWGNFFAIKIKDPLTQADVGWRTLMQYLDGSFTGISIDLEESEKDKALTNLQGFKMRFQALAGACEECHGTDERKYYVDQSVKGLITDLEKALSQPAPDMKRIGSISNDLGKDACLKCHLVHVPAAISQLPQMGLRAK